VGYIEFLRRMITSLNLDVNDEGILVTDNSDNGIVITNKSLPMVLPTKENIGTMFAIDPITKQPKPVKALFNPVPESISKGTSASFLKVRLAIEKNIGYALGVTIGLILKATMDIEKQQKLLSTELKMVVASFNASTKKKAIVESVVDETMIKTWNKLFQASLTAGASSLIDGMYSLLIKKSYTSPDGKIHPRVLVATCPLLQQLVDKNMLIHGVKLKDKDVVVFTTLLEYVLNQTEEKKETVIYTDEKVYPSFTLVVTGYIRIMERIMSLLDMVKDLDLELYESARVNLAVTESEISEINKLEKEIITIPSEGGPVPAPAQPSQVTVPTTVNTNIASQTPKTITELLAATKPLGTPGFTPEDNSPAAIIARNKRPSAGAFIPGGINSYNTQQPIIGQNYGVPNTIATPGIGQNYGMPNMQTAPQLMGGNILTRQTPYQQPTAMGMNSMGLTAAQIDANTPPWMDSPVRGNKLW